MPAKGQLTGKRAWNFKDITGQKFGRLTVLECLGYKFYHCGNKNSLWRCMCDCGKEVNVSRCTIRHFLAKGAKPSSKWGCVPSCGCSYREKLSTERRYYGFKVPRPKGQAGRNTLWTVYKGAAKGRGLEWGLSMEDFVSITQSMCHYCGCAPSKVSKSAGRDRGQDYVFNGIDRKDNGKGYVLGNVLPCCSICNWAKHTMAYDEFLAWLNRVAEYRISMMAEKLCGQTSGDM